MALSYINRMRNMESMLDDLYPEINCEYEKSKGFSASPA